MMININQNKLNEHSAAQVRTMRDQLLSECDWTMVADSPTDKEAWGKYRQELRDVTQQSEFPVQIIWPVEPT